MKSYEQTLEYITKSAPSLDYPSQFIEWAEVVAEVLSFVFNEDYELVTTELYDSVKEDQDFEEEV